MQRRFETDITIGFAYFHDLNMSKISIQFFNNWFINLQDFLFLMQGRLEENPKYKIATYDLNFTGTVSYTKKWITDPSYGYFSVSLSQSSKFVQEICVSNTFNGILATLGGYSTVLTGLFSFLLASYQSFVFDKSMLKRLFHQKEKEFDG